MIPVIYSDTFLLHQTGYGHPERPERLTAVVEALQTVPWKDQIAWRSPTSVHARDPLPLIQQVHHPAYVAAVQQLAERGGGQIDADTPVSAASYEVALLAVNAWLDGVDQVLATGKPAFVLARPPGHHAARAEGMGFCLFSNAAIAAEYALQQAEIQRVAILDWDVHHGNGTQAIVETHPQIAYCSLHQYPFYPGTGHAEEHGSHNNVLNLPIQGGSTLADYQPLFEQKIVPFLQAFQPNFLIVSAGYDANHADPLSSVSLKPSDFGILTQYCLQVGAPILFGLEGGYDLAALAASVVATLEPCLNL